MHTRIALCVSVSFALYMLCFLVCLVAAGAAVVALAVVGCFLVLSHSLIRFWIVASTYCFVCASRAYTRRVCVLFFLSIFNNKNNNQSHIFHHTTHTHTQNIRMNGVVFWCYGCGWKDFNTNKQNRCSIVVVAVVIVVVVVVVVVIVITIVNIIVTVVVIVAIVYL